MKPLSDIEKGWLAAAIDGEGSVIQDISRCALVVVNTDEAFIKYAAQLFGENSKIYVHQPPSPRKTKYVARLHIQFDIREILLQIIPYLIIKKEKAISLAEFCVGALERKARKHEGNGGAKLTEEKVARIRELYATRLFSQTSLAEAAGVSVAQIHNIVRRKQWV